MLLAILIIIGMLLVFYKVFVRKKKGNLIIENVNMSGKVVIVTGANTGIGFFIAKDLAVRGARVILACRSNERGTAARRRIEEETGSGHVVYKHLDLASLTSVRRFCDDILSTETRLDVLVNNAGVFGFGDQYSEDGIVLGMQINHVGPFLLTELLLPLIKKSKPSRIVNVNSIMHYPGFISVERINQKSSNDWLTYCNSKLFNVGFTVELARRLRGCQVSVNAVHPGVVKTNIVEHLDEQKNFNFVFYLLYYVMCWIFSRSAEEAAAQVVWACVDPVSGVLTGKFLLEGRIRLHSWRCYNKTFLLKLWQATEELVKGNASNANSNSI